MKLINRNGRLELTSEIALPVQSTLPGYWGTQCDEPTKKHVPNISTGSGERACRGKGRVVDSARLKAATEVSAVEKLQQAWNSLFQSTIVTDTMFSVSYFVGIGRTGYSQQESIRQEKTGWLYVLVTLIISIAVFSASSQSTDLQKKSPSLPDEHTARHVISLERNVTSESAGQAKKSPSRLYGQAPFILPEPASLHKQDGALASTGRD